MPGGISSYLADKLNDHVLGGGDFARPATVYAALFTVAPDALCVGGTEMSAGNYARVAITNNATNFPASSGSAKTNGTEIDFGTCTGADWGDAAALVLFDAASGGNRLNWAEPSTVHTVRVNDTFKIPAGSLVFSQVR